MVEIVVVVVVVGSDSFCLLFVFLSSVLLFFSSSVLLFFLFSSSSSFSSSLSSVWPFSWPALLLCALGSYKEKRVAVPGASCIQRPGAAFGVLALKRETVLTWRFGSDQDVRLSFACVVGW